MDRRDIDIGLNPTSASRSSMCSQHDRRAAEIANRVNELRHERIEKIERDINAFANESVTIAARRRARPFGSGPAKRCSNWNDGSSIR